MKKLLFSAIGVIGVVGASLAVNSKGNSTLFCTPNPTVKLTGQSCSVQHLDYSKNSAVGDPLGRYYCTASTAAANCLLTSIYVGD